MKKLKWIVSEDYEFMGNRINNIVAAFDSKILAEDFIDLVIPKDTKNRYKIFYQETT